MASGREDNLKALPEAGSQKAPLPACPSRLRTSTRASCDCLLIGGTGGVPPSADHAPEAFPWRPNPASAPLRRRVPEGESVSSSTISTTPARSGDRQPSATASVQIFKTEGGQPAGDMTGTRRSRCSYRPSPLDLPPVKYVLKVKGPNVAKNDWPGCPRGDDRGYAPSASSPSHDVHGLVQDGSAVADTPRAARRGVHRPVVVIPLRGSRSLGETYFATVSRAPRWQWEPFARPARRRCARPRGARPYSEAAGGAIPPGPRCSIHRTQGHVEDRLVRVCVQHLPGACAPRAGPTPPLGTLGYPHGLRRWPRPLPGRQHLRRPAAPSPPRPVTRHGLRRKSAPSRAHGVGSSWAAGQCALSAPAHGDSMVAAALILELHAGAGRAPQRLHRWAPRWPRVLAVDGLLSPDALPPSRREGRAAPAPSEAEASRGRRRCRVRVLRPVVRPAPPLVEGGAVAARPREAAVRGGLACRG